MQEKITLKETFSEYTLTSGQELLIDELNKFLSDNSTCFLLKGFAGTGKTVSSPKTSTV
jgi:excinuclease UvrABC helicase subunit UvrB